MDGFSLLREDLRLESPAWKMGVMLGAMRRLGWSFDHAWSSAIQRMRETPGMSTDEVLDLREWKATLSWSRPWYEWAYGGGVGEAPSAASVAARSALTDELRARLTDPDSVAA